jgi:hypothetical protein
MKIRLVTAVAIIFPHHIGLIYHVVLSYWVLVDMTLSYMYRLIAPISGASVLIYFLCYV